jgi:hypothetical protein
MRLITDDNVDQLLNMTQSGNINKLLDTKTETTADFKLLTEAYSKIRFTQKGNKTIAQKMEELARYAEVAPVKEPPKRVQALEKKDVGVDKEKGEEEGEGEEKEGVAEEAIINMPSWNARNTRLIEPHVWDKIPDWDQPQQTWDQAPPALNQDQKQGQPQQSPDYADSNSGEQQGQEQVHQSPGYASEEKEQPQKQFQPKSPSITPPDLPPTGWVRYVSKKDPNNLIPYYFNEKTGMSVWNISDIPVEKQTILTTVEPEEGEGEGDELKTGDKNETRKIITSE